ncbi:MAG: cyclophilin-type peptidyl-prolyl cis-trans isomerase [Monoraphidium minutum]|nr:MAG: cyclophilin-type peptidyl-prolyl cis-trans isomerase [Monoraphidium minutum]
MMRLIARPLASRIQIARPQARRLAVKPSALLKTAPGCGASWSQNTEEVLLRVPVESGVRGRDVQFEAHPKRVTLKVGGQEVVSGGLADAGEIDIDGTFWTLESEGDKKVLLVTLAKKHSGHESWQFLFEADRPDTSVTHRCFLDVQGEKGRGGRLVVGLYGNLAPRTADNFRALCSGEKGAGQVAERLHFKGSPFHRIIPGFMAQAGDITQGNGMGGESIYGEAFEDETFKGTHAGRGTLAMANAGPDTNGSQFYITFGPAPHLDGKHVVFGQVEAGWDTLAFLEGVGSNAGTPSEKITITDCGVAGLESDPEALAQEYKAAAVAAEEEQQQQQQHEAMPAA